MEHNPQSFRSEFNERQSPLTRQILRALSENSRISILELSKKLGVSRRTVKERIKKAEQELGIRYTIELDEEMLGLNYPHIIMLKFINKPDYKEVIAMLEKYYIPQTVMLTRGKYDMLIFANATTSQDYVHWDKTMQIALSKYGVLWQSSDVAHRQLGFFPARSVLIDRLAIPQKYKEMLKLLNTDARISFKEISGRLNMHFNTVAYNFKKLVELGYIKRFTLVMKPQDSVTLMSTFCKYVMAENFEVDASRIRREVLTSDDKEPIMCRFPFASQLVGSYDFFFVGIFDSYDVAYKRQVQYTKQNFKRHRVKVLYGEVTAIPLGNLPLRSIDVKKEYNTLKWIADPAEVSAMQQAQTVGTG